MASARYSDLQLDALRELANVGSGTAGTALSALLGRPVDISVPNAAALELADAVDAAGAAEDVVWAVVVSVGGDLEASALLVDSERDAEAIGALLGVETNTDEGRSALEEVGNILVASYVGALASMTGFVLDLHPPASARDMLGAVVATVIAARRDGRDVAIMLDSELRIEQEAIALSFMLLPTPEGVDELLERIGLGG
jgi:chemotaxis protein CheC